MERQQRKIQRALVALAVAGAVGLSVTSFVQSGGHPAGRPIRGVALGAQADDDQGFTSSSESWNVNEAAWARSLGLGAVLGLILAVSAGSPQASWAEVTGLKPDRE
ncbi:unnamed protein product, partial [Polarella glacialis]